MPVESSSSVSEPVVSDELQPGALFAGWTVESLIGKGGMGTVYRVSRGTARAALKILQPDYLANERYRQRFLFECQQLQTLNHPNIVRLLEFGTLGDVPYLIMELIEGTDLHTLVEERGPLPWQQAVRLVLTVARGLEFARRRGLIHRDIKPENVLLQRKGKLARARIVDFGLIKQISTEHGDENLLTLQPQDWFGVMDRFQAHMDRVLQRDWSRRRTDHEIRQVLRELRDVLYTAKQIELPSDADTSRRARPATHGATGRRKTRSRGRTTTGRGRSRALGLTQDGECLGTPYFMAPEMWLEVPADHRADIFSLGVTLYFLVTGQYPFEGETVADVMRSTIQSPPTPVDPDRVPPDLQDVMLRMLAKLPEQRYHRYRNLIDDLMRMLSHRRPQIDFMGVAYDNAIAARPPKDAAEVLFDILQSFLEHAGIETQQAGAIEDDSNRDPSAPLVSRPPQAAPLNPLGPERFRDALAGERLVGEACLGKDAPVFEFWLAITNRALRVYRASDRFWFLQRGPRDEQPPPPMPMLMLQANMTTWSQEGPLLSVGGLQFVVLENEVEHVRSLLQSLTGSLPAAVRRTIARAEKDTRTIGRPKSTAVIESLDFSLPGEHDVELFDDDLVEISRADELAALDDVPPPPPPPRSPAARTRIGVDDLAVPSTPPPPPPMSPARQSQAPVDEPLPSAGGDSDDEQPPTLPPDIPPLPDDSRRGRRR